MSRGEAQGVLHLHSVHLNDFEESIRHSLNAAVNAVNRAGSLGDHQQSKRLLEQFSAQHNGEREFSDLQVGWDEESRQHLEEAILEAQRAQTASGKLFTIDTVTGGPLSFSSNWQRINATLAQKESLPTIQEFEGAESIPFSVGSAGARSHLTPMTSLSAGGRINSAQSAPSEICPPSAPSVFGSCPSSCPIMVDASTETDSNWKGATSLWHLDQSDSNVPESELHRAQAKEAALKWKLDVSRQELAKYLDVDVGHVLTEVEKMEREVNFYTRERLWLYKRIIELECEIAAMAAPPSASKAGVSLKRKGQSRYVPDLMLMRTVGCQVTPCMLREEVDPDIEEEDDMDHDAWVLAKHRDRLVHLGVSTEAAEGIASRLLNNMKTHVKAYQGLLRGSFSLSLQMLLPGNEGRMFEAKSMEAMKHFQADDAALLVDLMATAINSGLPRTPTWPTREPAKNGLLSPIQRSNSTRFDFSSISSPRTPSLAVSNGSVQTPPLVSVSGPVNNPFPAFPQPPLPHPMGSHSPSGKKRAHNPAVVNISQPGRNSILPSPTSSSSPIPTALPSMASTSATNFSPTSAAAFSISGANFSPTAGDALLRSATAPPAPVGSHNIVLMKDKACQTAKRTTVVPRFQTVSTQTGEQEEVHMAPPQMTPPTPSADIGSLPRSPTLPPPRQPTADLSMENNKPSVVHMGESEAVRGHTFANAMPRAALRKGKILKSSLHLKIRSPSLSDALSLSISGSHIEVPESPRSPRSPQSPRSPPSPSSPDPKDTKVDE